jgi:hypothetical protein
LLLDDFVAGDQLAHPKVADLHAALPIEENIVQFDVPVQHRAAVAVSHALSNLFENILGLILRKFFALPYKMVEVAPTSILHDHHNVLFVLEDLIETNNI